MCVCDDLLISAAGEERAVACAGSFYCNMIPHWLSLTSLWDSRAYCERHVCLFAFKKMAKLFKGCVRNKKILLLFQMDSINVQWAEATQGATNLQFECDATEVFIAVASWALLPRRVWVWIVLCQKLKIIFFLVTKTRKALNREYRTFTFTQSL